MEEGLGRLAGVIATETPRDLLFLNILFEVEDHLDRLFVRVRFIVMLGFHGQRVTVASDRAALLL